VSRCSAIQKKVRQSPKRVTTTPTHPTPDRTTPIALCAVGRRSPPQMHPFIYLNKTFFYEKWNTFSIVPIITICESPKESPHESPHTPLGIQMVFTMVFTMSVDMAFV
jgi:hypothetical protein